MCTRRRPLQQSDDIVRLVNPIRQVKRRAARWGRYLALALVGALLLSACVRDSRNEPDPSAWAKQICALAQAYTDAGEQATVSRPDDESTFPLAERITFRRAYAAAWIPAAQSFIDGMANLAPPKDAEGYQRALSDRLSRLKTEWEALNGELDGVSTAAQLDARDARLRALDRLLQQQVDEQASRMKAATLDALQSEPKCPVLND